jgi:hypothetical protein
MGTWSRPLFATVGVGAPSDYVIDISIMSEEERVRWRHSAFLNDATKTRWNLVEFMNTGCDTHKIIDHMDREQTLRWETLFRQLYSAYPALRDLAFHFYCSDGSFPYFLTMGNESGAKLELHYGHSESYKYFRPRWHFPWTAVELREPPQFMPEWYRAAYLAGAGTLDMRVIRLDSSRMIW